MGNERGVSGNFGIKASSILDNTHVAVFSRLYGYTSWCSKAKLPPHYLEFDFRKVITVTGIATQGDNIQNKWVTRYAISHGYNGQNWISYAAGQVK